MGAGGFIKQQLAGGLDRIEGMISKGLARDNHCSCHPRQWGLKKGLRRARRRYDKEVIAEGIEDGE